MTGGWLRVALVYLRAGLTIIPVGSNKKALVQWKEFQTRRVTEPELREWGARFRDAGWALVCGTVSGRVVVDLDPRNAADRTWLPQVRAAMPSTPTALTPRGGYHLHFLPPDGPLTAHAKVGALRPGIDYQGEASYVLLPPSRSEFGDYRWNGTWKAQPEPAPLPFVIKHWLDGYDRRREREERPHALIKEVPGLRLEQVLARVRNPKQTRGGGWKACCPAHADQEPSLSIGFKDGRLLLHCFAGCRFERIVEALRPAPGGGMISPSSPASSEGRP